MKDVEKERLRNEIRQLYALPDHLNVDCSKDDSNVRFADRTASHIKNGLLEVHLEPLPQKSD